MWKLLAACSRTIKRQGHHGKDARVDDKEKESLVPSKGAAAPRSDDCQFGFKAVDL